MGFLNYRKESSERSDKHNWAKRALIENTNYKFESIEGCSQNANNMVTHLMERTRVDFNKATSSTENEVLQKIINLEGSDSLLRKINFAARFHLPLSYALYCNENHAVCLYEISSLDNCKLIQEFDSYEGFSKFISTIKGWDSSKAYREIADLPYFDKELRRAGTAWPTNIDCFVSTSSNQPIAILEFQNAKNSSVARHCNNDFFLCKLSGINQRGQITYYDDIRRWTSQEILRLQSDLRLFIITWSQNEDDFFLKEIELISFPYLPYAQNWSLTNQYKADLHKFANSKTRANAKIIANQYSSLNLSFQTDIMHSIINHPPLSKENKTFPSIYYSYKRFIQGRRGELANLFKNLLGE